MFDYWTTYHLACQSLSHVQLFDPMVCSLTGSSIHGIFQATILEWVAIFFSRGSFWLRNQIHISCISCIGRWILYHCTTRKASTTLGSPTFFQNTNTESIVKVISLHSSAQNLNGAHESSPTTAISLAFPLSLHTGLSVAWTIFDTLRLYVEKEMATHTSILAWRIPWMEEPGGLQSKGSQRVRHDWATSLSLSLCHYNKLPQTQWLKTTQIHSLTV